MTRHLQMSSLLVTTALSLGFAVPAMAQSDAPAIGEVVVTARRVEERLQDVPISITVFNQQQLAQRNISAPTDLANNTPSLSADTQYGVDNTAFSLRGFTQVLQTSPTVGVYFDDVVAPRGGPTLHSGDGAAPGDFFDLQNVQVLKGPQGTLFGRNTTGGAVLLVPAKPTDKFEGFIEGSVGNDNMRRLQAVVNVPVNDQLRFRVGVDRQVRDGYLKNISGIGPRDFANIDYTALRGSVVWDISPSLQNYTVLKYVNSGSRGPGTQMFVCDPAAGFGFLACPELAQVQAGGHYAIESNQADPHSSLHQWQAINTTTWDATNWLTIKNITSYAHLKNSFQSNLFGDNLVLPSFFPPPFGGAKLLFISVDSPPGTNMADQSTFTEELQFQGHMLNNRLTWQAGGYLEISRPAGPNHVISPTLVSCTNLYALQCTDVLGTLAGRPGTLGLVTDKADAIDYRNMAAYFQGTYKFTDRWRLTAGIRETSDRTRSWARVTNYIFPAPNTPVPFCPSRFTNLAQGCFRGFTQSSSKPTWLIDLDYTPSPDVLVYAKYARGYRQGDANPVAADGYNTWGPETVDNYEVGSKTSFEAPFPMTIDVAAFYNDFSNQQITVGFQGPPPATPNNGVVSTGKARIYGVELDVTASPIENLVLNVGYTYLNSRLKSLAPIVIDPATGYTIATPASLVGDPMQYTPKHKATASADYTLPLDDKIGKISIGATAVYTDPQQVFSGTPLGIIPAYTLLGLHADWTSIGGRPVDLSLFVTNVTNKFYWSSMSDLLATVGWDTRLPGEPRMYGLRLRARFGS